MEARPVQHTRIRTGTPGDGVPAHFRRVVSFTPRGGRLNDVQRRAWEAHAPAWYLDVDGVGTTLDPVALFGRDAPLVVEIGSGMGESTAAMAKARPEANILAIEVYRPGVAQTFHHLARAGVDNVRVLRADAVQVLTELVRPGSLAEIWLFFPDPWPKTRHIKRRLVSAEFAELAASRLRRGGLLRMATDWEPYALQMLAVLGGVKSLRNVHPGWAPRPAFRPRTRFERRGLSAGREINDLEFVRR
ncbi:tRNA (guanosine(46)-N7)-methyltransferase TrmB [Nakamurella alba]|uniref:tRNA (guanosine(46)-N7)-methyltransferase TrmB n=1 Tax=Nakamurella alba TaxID=2665158 RepID=UPI002AC3443B|nr:tRNA (guanosine(46)-N7)-methyltransferase TrmB [Nakamurella alba]